MPVRDCGLCKRLQCGGVVSGAGQFYTLTDNLLCEIAENEETFFPEIISVLEQILIAIGGGSGTCPAGANYQFQYYDDAACAGAPVVNYNPVDDRLVVGDPAETYGFFTTPDTKNMTNSLITSIGTSFSPFNILKLASQWAARVDPPVDTNSGVGVTLYSAGGVSLTLAGDINYNGGLPLSSLGQPFSGLGSFATVSYRGNAPGTIDGLGGVLYTCTHTGEGGAAGLLSGASFAADTADDLGLGTPTGSVDTLNGGTFTTGATGVNVATAYSLRAAEPIAYDGNTGAPIPTITNQTANWIDGTYAITRTDIASAASITNMPVLSSFRKLTGVTATTVHGIHADGFSKFITIYNATNTTMTLAHQSGTEGTAANRIISPTGANVVIAAGFSAHLFYDLAQSRWIIDM